MNGNPVTVSIIPLSVSGYKENGRGGPRMLRQFSKSRSSKFFALMFNDVAHALTSCVAKVKSAFRQLTAYLRDAMGALLATSLIVGFLIWTAPAADASTISAARNHVPLSGPVQVNNGLRHIRTTCLGSVSPATPTINSYAFVTESSLNQVEVINQQTGSVLGSPIPVGTTPLGIAYWNPQVNTTQDAEVVATNSASRSVTVIDAILKTVLATVTLPSGSGATSVAASPASPYAIAVDALSGKVSIINLTNNTDAGEITLTSTASALSSIAFSSSGAYAYVTDPSEHKIFVIKYTGGSAPYYSLSSTYTNSSYKPTGIATDTSSPSSNLLIVGDAQSSTGHLLSFTDNSASLSAPTSFKTFTASVPEAISLSPGGATAVVAMNATRTVNEVNTSSGTTTSYFVPSTFSSVGPIGLSDDGSTIYAGDTGGSSVQEMSFAAGTSSAITTTAAVVSAIAPAYSYGGWNAYVVTSSSSIDVINTGTQSIIQKITDANSPQYVAVSPDGKFAYVANTSSVSVITTALVGTPSNPITTTITAIQGGSQPNTAQLNGVQVSPTGDSILVTDYANGAVDVIDTNPSDGASYLTVVGRYGLLGTGDHSTTQYAPGGMAFSPDGLYAYISEVGNTGSTNDGIAVLKLASATTTGYTLTHVDTGLTQATLAFQLPGAMTINPNDQALYVSGSSSGIYATQGGMWTFAINGSDGEVTNGSSTVGPVWLGEGIASMAYSPETAQVLASQVSSNHMYSISVANNNITYNATTKGLSSQVTFSPDGIYAAQLTALGCSGTYNSVDILDAATGLRDFYIDLGSDTPYSIAFAPQSAPRVIPVSDLAGGASNPSEAGVAAQMNDVVGAGTPSDAPGASGGVDTATLAYSFSLDSLNLPDLGLSLDQNVTYDSANASTAGLFGKGWSYGYGITFAQNSYSASSNPCALIFTQENGATVSFYPVNAPSGGSCSTSASSYRAPPWAQVALSTQSSCNGSDSCWVFQRTSGVKYAVDRTTAQLVSETDLNANAVTISWGAHGSTCSGATSSQPCQVLGADKVRTLTFSYPSPGAGTCPSGATSCVVVSDPLSRTVTYVKNSTSQLTAVTLANSSTSGTYTFAYNSSSLMTSWCDPQNSSTCSTDATYSTQIAWSGSLVTSVVGPTTAWSQGSILAMTHSASTTTFSRLNYDTTAGTGTVEITNPDFNYSASMHGANQILDTYVQNQLVSSVSGYGPLSNYGSTDLAPQTSETAIPVRDLSTLLPDEIMDGRGGTLSPATSARPVNGDSGVTVTLYDANGNPLVSTDPSNNSTVTTYNQFNEPLTATDANGNVTTNTYDANGNLLKSTSPATNSGGTNPKAESYYNANGTLCASRDAVEVAKYGDLTSCVSAGAGATTYTYYQNLVSGSYVSSGDLKFTVDPASDTTQIVYDANGNVCASLTANGYYANGALTSCPSAGVAYATVNLNSDLYGSPLETVQSVDTSGTTFAKSFSCVNVNGDVTTSVGAMAGLSSVTCSSLSPTTSTYTSFSFYDPEGNAVQQIAPLLVSGTQGLTTTTGYDLSGNAITTLSPQGYVAWVANSSVDMTPYESVQTINNNAETFSSAPAADSTTTCIAQAQGASAKACPDASVSTFNGNGDSVAQLSPSATTSTSSATSASGLNPDGTSGAESAPINTTGSTPVIETTSSTYDANAQVTGSTSTHLVSGSPVTDSTTSTAYAPDGSTCWTAPVSVTTPSCSAPPAAVTSADYYDLNGALIATVGPGGADNIYPGHSGYCDPTAAFSSSSPYALDTTKICAFTTYYVHDEVGRLTETMLPGNSNSTTVYVGSSNFGAVTTETYDHDGNVATLTNPASQVTTNVFDATDRLSEVRYSDLSTHSCQISTVWYATCYSYNLDGTRSQMIDASGTTTYSYDLLGRLTQVVDSNSKTVTYGYNALGQLVCLSYPLSGSSNTCSTSGAGTNSPPTGDVTYDYDTMGRLSSVVTWTLAFTYAYECNGAVAWMSETPNTQIPSVTMCQGASGTVTAAPTPPSGTTYLETLYSYDTAANGGHLLNATTSSVSSSGATALVGFGGTSSNPLTYDDNGNVTTSTPYLGTSAQTADVFTYDSQQRVTKGPQAGSSSNSTINYVNNPGSGPYSGQTVDEMAINTEAGASISREMSYRPNGKICWMENALSGPSGTCGTPGAAYESFSTDASGNRTAVTASGFGTNSSYSWNQDTGTMSCVNPTDTTCPSTPSSAEPATLDFTYNADGLRTQQTAWSTSTSAVVTTPFTWETQSTALLSDGTFLYLYGLNANVPIAQFDVNTSVSGALVTDTNANVRAVIELHNSSADTLTHYVDYDAYGNPISGNGGSVASGGLSTIVGTDPDSISKLGFGGGYLDPTALIYLVHRYYDASTGAFISVDPMLSSTGTPYSYAGDNPVGATDYLGLCGSWRHGHFHRFFRGSCANASAESLRITGAMAQQSYNDVHPGGAWGAFSSFVKNYDPFYASLNDGIGASYQLAQGHYRSALWDAAKSYGNAVMGFSILIPGVGEAELAARVGTEVVVEEGIYVVRTPLGTYVGQAGRISARLAQHLSRGKFTAADLVGVERIAVGGGKTAREIAEQLKIDELGGVGKLLNKVNPIGRSRFFLMYDGYAR
jgi:RHS repeat-associated protein